MFERPCCMTCTNALSIGLEGVRCHIFKAEVDMNWMKDCHSYEKYNARIAQKAERRPCKA